MELVASLVFASYCTSIRFIECTSVAMDSFV